MIMRRSSRSAASSSLGRIFFYSMDAVRAELLKIPPVTRTIILSTIGVTLPPMLALINPYHLILSWPQILRRWEIWRIFSAF
jgi:Der1-like family